MVAKPGRDVVDFRLVEVVPDGVLAPLDFQSRREQHVTGLLAESWQHHDILASVTHQDRRRTIGRRQLRRKARAQRQIGR